MSLDTSVSGTTGISETYHTLRWNELRKYSYNRVINVLSLAVMRCVNLFVVTAPFRGASVLYEQHSPKPTPILHRVDALANRRGWGGDRSLFLF